MPVIINFFKLFPHDFVLACCIWRNFLAIDILCTLISTIFPTQVTGLPGPVDIPQFRLTAAFLHCLGVISRNRCLNPLGDHMLHCAKPTTSDDAWKSLTFEVRMKGPISPHRRIFTGIAIDVSVRYHSFSFLASFSFSFSLVISPVILL